MSWTARAVFQYFGLFCTRREYINAVLLGYQNNPGQHNTMQFILASFIGKTHKLYSSLSISLYGCVWQPELNEYVMLC